jgi:ribose 5-phosphate isomerase A
VVGLGSGRTAAAFIRALGERVRAGLRVLGIPTSEHTARLARAEGIALTTLEEHPRPEIAVDGADAIDPALQLLKGRGGALVREKIVATAAARFVVVVDEQKVVGTLAESPVVPVEVVPFGWSRTLALLESLGAVGTRRMRSGAGAGRPFESDNGNHVLDCRFADFSAPADLAARIKSLPGVVDHGLFVDLASQVIVGHADGRVRVMTPSNH